MIGRGISTTVGGLLIVLGLRSLLVAPDPETQLPRWMESISSISPPRAFDFGVALFPIQIKNLAIFVACLELIAAASLGPGGHAVALGLALLVFAIPVLALIGLYATMPHRASTMLGSLRTWMEKNSRAITLVLCSVFGAFFLITGPRDRKTMANRSRSTICMLERVILAVIAGAVASPVIACLSRETPLQGLHRSRVPHTIGGYGG